MCVFRTREPMLQNMFISSIKGYNTYVGNKCTPDKQKVDIGYRLLSYFRKGLNEFLISDEIYTAVIFRYKFNTEDHLNTSI